MNLLSRSIRPGAALLVVALTVAGCGPSAPYKTVKIRGKVTYDDGTPIPGHRVRVQFLPQVPAVNSKEYPKFANVELKPDGSFDAVTTWKYGDGVIPGPQKVMVLSIDQKQNPTGAVDPQYGTADTPLKVEIQQAGPIELTVPKPSQPAKRR